MRDIFVLNEIWSQDKVYIFCYALGLVYIFYLLLSNDNGSEL
jgi:hypothetical protein